MLVAVNDEYNDDNKHNDNTTNYYIIYYSPASRRGQDKRGCL